MFKIKLTAQARRELKSLSVLDKLRLGEIIEEFKDDPFVGKSLSRKLTGKFSYRVGVYRIIYKINETDKIVNVLSAGHRSLVYQVN